MKKILLGIFFSVMALIPAKADEGMWLMMFIHRLNYVDMQKEGLKLTPEEIYNVNHSSLKDAVVSFGGFCTGEIVSDKGLVLTNHHCGYSSVAELSTPEHDYLNNGYFAKNPNEELPAKGLYVRFLVRMGDATERINALLERKSEQERAQIIKEESEKIEKENSENGKYIVTVKSFFQGNEFYYFVYQDFKDIRFIGAPPASIGKFGGDTDNWEWPRHTGDFSMFRIYADKNGNPAEYSPDNVPYHPQHSLSLNISGFRPGDFTMVMGYPGTTSRYLTSYGIQQLIDYEYPPFIEASKTAMDVVKKYMNADKATQLNYAGKYASIANYWKNRIGMIEAIKKNNVIIEKEKEEAQFSKWLNTKSDRKKQYGNVLNDLKSYYQATNDNIYSKMYLYGIIRGSSYASVPYRLGNMIQAYIQQDSANREIMKPKLLEAVTGIYENLHPEVEKDLLADLCSLYVSKVAKDRLFPEIQILSQSQDFKQTVFNLAAGSVFENKENILDFIEKPNADVLQNDPLYLISKEMITFYTTKDEIALRLDETYNQAQRNFIEGLRRTFPDKTFYPDANSTMRLTYGTVKTLIDNPQKTNDAHENYYTTLKGMIGKYKKGDDEFDLPQKLIDLYSAKDFGQYVNEYGEVPVDFLSDNDITGGNSGSPVINAKGELIGLAFDGNWEAMSGNILFDENLQRCINTDIRFVLFIIDKYADAQNLINEMKIVK